MLYGVLRGWWVHGTARDGVGENFNTADQSLSEKSEVSSASSIKENHGFPGSDKASCLNFPGGAVNCQRSGPGFNPWSGNQIPRVAAKCLHAATKDPPFST